jgi:aminoglycoside phosphotransferase (APT) family kinase protein
VSDFIDKTRQVREGEEIDLDRLRDFMEEALGARPETLAVEQFPGGHSNLTYLVRYDDQECVLRRPPRGSKVKTAHDMGREHRILSALAPVYPLAPKPLATCTDDAVIGAPFYLMQRITGVILRKRVPEGMTIDEPTARRLCERFVDTMVDLHTLDYEAIGLGDLGRPEGYIERQITGWTKRYAGSQTDDIPDVEQIAAWLADHMPADGPPGLIHNDYKFDNLILDPSDVTRIIGILDWEMSTIGDPLMDLGTTLCYWIEVADPPIAQAMAFVPTNIPGMFTRREVAERYAEKTGRDLSEIVFYYAYGLFKTAVVAQQIYYRFKQGLTKDERFERMIFGVRLLAAQALAAVAKGSL